MPTESNIELGSGRLYIKGVDEPLDISDGTIELTTEYADEYKPIKIRDTQEFTFECSDVWINQDWTLVYCEKCRQPFPITQFHALTRGEVGWYCPLCAAIKRFRERHLTDCCCGV
jgi:RNase P subunit RPR2